MSTASKRFTGLRRRVAMYAAALLAFAGTGLAVAHADASDPVLPFHASVTMVGGQPVLTLTGGWTWSTHKSDCNKDRYAVGYAIDWFDASAPGNLVGTVNNQAISVGTPTDNNVHFIHLSTDADPTGDPVGATRCGTYNAGLGYNTGNWGPISHTYPAGTTTFKTCAVTYDMHEQGNTGTLQKNDDIAGGQGHNGDNSVQGNNDTPLGNECTTFYIPTITTVSSPATASAGQGFSDTATLTGYDPAQAPTGSIIFTLHSATDNSAAQHCGAVVAGVGPFTVAVSKLSSSPDVYGAATPTVNPGPGTYYWQASYGGDSHNSAVDGNCDDPNESSAITKASPSISTQATASALVGDSISDTATLSGVNAAADPTGSITFTLYPSTGAGTNHCTGTAITTLGPVTVSKLSSSPDVFGAVSPSYQPSAAGDVYWQASYNGDGLNAGADGFCDDANEHTTVTQATPGITTQADNSNLQVGSKISDKAILSAVNPNAAPTGTIAFSLYTSTTGSGNGCGTAVAGYSDSENVVLLSSSPDVYGAVSSQFQTPSSGNFYWLAVYSGDTGNAGVSGHCTDAGETSSVGLTQPSITTNAQASAIVPGPIHDTATLSGYNGNQNPTGTVSFTLYSSLNAQAATGCGTAVSGPDSVNLVALQGGGFGATSPNVGVSTPGTYYWLAAYSGDGSNAAASGKCTDANESSSVSIAAPGISTQVSNASITVESSISDQATISGGSNPTGTVTFDAWDNSSCSSAGGALFESTNNLVNGVANSDDFTPTSTGTVYWSATYNGDANNGQASEPCTAANEQTVVNPAAPSLTTSATPSVTLPAAALSGADPQIQDVATIHSGTASASGTVTFKLFGPVATNTPTCTTLVTSVDGTVNSGVAVSTPVTVTQAGYYFWEAKYNGDPNNTATAFTACGDDNEVTQATQADLSLSKVGLTNGPNPSSPVVQPGQTINYTVSIPNSGNSDIDDATVTDTLPAYVDVNAASISGGGVFTAGSTLSQSAGKIVWDDVDIDAGTTTHLTYSVTVDASVPQGTVLTNLVRLGSLSATTHHQVPSGSLALTKQVNKTKAKYGQTLTYTLHAKAIGALVQHNVTVKDYLPGYNPHQTGSGKTSYVAGSADCSGSGTCVTSFDPSTHQITWQIGTMTGGDTRTLTFQAKIVTPPTSATGALPIETVVNVGRIFSHENPSADPSNVVRTDIQAVLGEKVVRHHHHHHHHQVLPNTGAPLKIIATLALLLLAGGIGLQFAQRRRLVPVRGGGARSGIDRLRSGRRGR